MTNGPDRFRVRARLEAAVSFMSSFSKLLRYVLITILVAVAIVFTADKAISGKSVSLAGLISGLPVIGGAGSDSGPSLKGPIFNFEFKPESKKCPATPPV